MCITQECVVTLARNLTTSTVADGPRTSDWGQNAAGTPPLARCPGAKGSAARRAGGEDTVGRRMPDYSRTLGTSATE